MNSSIETRLASLAERFEEIERLLADPRVIGKQEQFRKLSQEYAEINPVVKLYGDYRLACDQMESARAMLKDKDASIREMAEEEIADAQQLIARLEAEIQTQLLPKDPNDNRNVFLEIRAAAGGDESAIFAGDLFRMYNYYATNHGWDVEVMSQSPGEHGGYKEIIARIAGKDVYSRLKFESGAHRVQRVHETEAQGRIHTSTCTVAVLPEAEEVDAIAINPAELKVDTFRASGAGGQHKTRSRAMSILSARLLEAERRKQREQEAATRKSLVGTGDRSERIRTYNFPQGRVTYHRINLTLYKLDQAMEGKIDEL